LHEDSSLKIYLVGGAVRDYLLQNGWSDGDKDYVVVGATPHEMIAKGFRQVGKSFPVFLHPETQEEYALARTEKKIGKGYTAFETIASPDVTLEDDLKRRDLTINAIAMPVVDGQVLTDNIIDLYDGVRDLELKVFRHVSEAFIEDPVRILRLARFACRFCEFQVAPETTALLEKMVDMGEVDALVPERVWQEWASSLDTPCPWRWFDVLESCGAKAKLFPSIENLAVKKIALEDALSKDMNLAALLAIELYDQDESQLSHLGRTYRIPNEYYDLALLTVKFYGLFCQNTWTAEGTLAFFEKTDAFRRTARFRDFVAICKVLAGAEGKSIVLPDLSELLDVVLKIDNQRLLSEGFVGADFARELRQVRVETLQRYLDSDSSRIGL
jgi:tRNA nucleotidyltransferase (CCA-adding enzyme)